MNIKFIAILCCLIFLCSLSAQNSVIHPAIQVVKAKEISRPEKVALFKPIADRSSEVLSVLQSYTLMSLDNEALGKLTNQKAPFIELSIPTPNQKDIEVELVEVHPFSPDFKVRIAPSMEEVQVGQGEYYRGIVKGEEGSIVALSIVDGEVAGLISSPSLSGNMVIGKLKQSDNYVIYEDHQINGKSNFNCLTADYQIAYTPEELRGISSGSRKENDCIRIYFEVDYDIYVDKGKNVENVSSFVTAIFNQVSMLYAAEDINIVLSEVVVWTQQSPYTATTASGMLNQFTGYRQGFNGDLAQLLSYKIGGGIAYIDGLCKSNPDYSMSYAGIYNSFQNVPTYSWTIEVVTHELGHLFGSQHTHACVWNGNKTAIDGCYNIEGSCPNPGIPSPQQGGTIMSYCHLTNAGIKFSNGFGLQPGNVIRSKVAAASCLTSCLPDGGGTECELNKVILEINTDNYPSETTWDIKNQQGQILYSGGPYYSPRSLSTIELCLPTSCFIFTIYDLYQDGMCCSYGNGSYKIKFEGNTLISGGQFGASESKQFCISSQPAPTCTDGKKNGLETGIDCGGPNCPPCPTCHDGIKNGQETGIDCGGPDCEPCATCTDGKKNGLETGIDCGGPNCPPCPTCHDGIKNGQETGIDCGGPDCEPCATCTDGKKNGLETGIDCGGPNCPPCPTCHDGIKNGQETGIDCGGPDCEPCATCTDGKKNGLETGIDCGGPNCPPCPTCHDGIKNGLETGIDCGGPDCEPCATCTDGKKNGLETGIDCGGPNCPPCPTCHDGIKNGLETGIDCGGPDCEPCATCTDGKKNGLETGIDCGGPNCPPCPTCHDGIKNGLETGIDCGGPDCEPCKPVHMGEVTETFIAGYYFEQGWDNWTDGGDFCSRVRSISSPEGRYSIRLRNNNGEHSSMTSESLMIDEYDSLQVEFSFRALRFGDGDQFKLKYFDGTQWQTARTFIYDQDFINNDQYQKKVHIRFKNISATRIKFEADAQQPTNQIYIDAVVLTGFKTILIDSGSCEDGMLNGMETGIDCGGPNCPPCPTCDDGIQNGYEIGIDCGGPDCLPCITPPEDFEYGAYFETGWDGWLDGGKDCSRYYGNPSPEGAYSIKIRGNSSEQSSMTSQPFDLSMYETVTFQFMFIATGMNNREGFVFQYHDGTSWKKLVHFKAGLHFVNNQTYRVTYTTSSKANDATRFRFQSAGSGEGAMVFIDAVVINVSTATSLVEHPLIIEEVGVPLTDLKISNVPRVFPNPATDILQIKSGEAIHRINIYNPTGQLLKTYNGETNEWLDISELMPGMYILRIETSDDIFVEKILKQ